MKKLYRVECEVDETGKKRTLGYARGEVESIREYYEGKGYMIDVVPISVENITEKFLEKFRDSNKKIAGLKKVVEKKEDEIRKLEGKLK